MDSSPIFSLAIADKLELLEALFDVVRIPKAVWNEITKDATPTFYQKILLFFKDRTIKISGLNELSFIMDPGESESIILYKEINADFLLIDDRKARDIAESMGIKCIGTIGLLAIAKEKGLIEQLKPIFEIFLSNKRYYSVELLNKILERYDEKKII